MKCFLNCFGEQGGGDDPENVEALLEYVEGGKVSLLLSSRESPNPSLPPPNHPTPAAITQR